MVDHYYNIFIYLMIIQSSNHIYLQSFLAARNALLGDEERVEAAKAGGVSTPPFNSTKTSILSPTLIAACVSSKYVWFDSTSHLCTYFLHALLLVKTPFSPPIFNHQTAPKEKALFVGPIPWKLTRPPFSDCSCCSIICKRDWRGGETRRRDETTRRPAARWTVKTLEAKEWKPQGFQLRNYKVKVTWWRTTQSFFYNIFLSKLKKYITSNVESTWKLFLKHVDLTSGHPWLALIGCYIFRNSSTSGTLPTGLQLSTTVCIDDFYCLNARAWCSFHRNNAASCRGIT